MTTPLIIQARVNENTMRSGNANLPYSSDEILSEATSAYEAGASILHWHGREPETGDPHHEPESYAEVVTLVRHETDLILKPTLGFLYKDAVDDRLAHVRAGVAEPDLTLDMAAVDLGSINIDEWNPERGVFVPGDRVYVNTRQRLVETFQGLADAGVYAACACWDIGQVRTARCLQQAGVLQTPTYWEFVFTGDSLPSGPAAELHALQSFVAAIPPGEHWEVMCVGGDVMSLVAWAITLGGHVAIGLGDYAYERFGQPNNGELVRRVAELAETLGRPVANPEETRELLGMRARSIVGTKGARQ